MISEKFKTKKNFFKIELFSDVLETFWYLTFWAPICSCLAKYTRQTIMF